MNKSAESESNEYNHVLLFSGISKQELLPMLDCLGSYIKSYKSGEIIILTEDAVKSLGIILKCTDKGTEIYEVGRAD